MWRSKKLIIAGLLAAVLLVGGSAGVAMADTGDDSGPVAKFGEFIDKVCGIYEQKTEGLDTIDNPEALKEALAEARSEMSPKDCPLRGEMDLEALLEEGKITQEQYDNMKARMESMRYVLSQIDYGDKDTKHISFECDPEVLQVYEKSDT